MYFYKKESVKHGCFCAGGVGGSAWRVVLDSLCVCKSVCEHVWADRSGCTVEIYKEYGFNEEVAKSY